MYVEGTDELDALPEMIVLLLVKVRVKPFIISGVHVRYGSRSSNIHTNGLLLVRATGGEAASGCVQLVREAIRMKVQTCRLHEKDVHLFHQMELVRVRKEVMDNSSFQVCREQGSRGSVKKRIDPLQDPCSCNSSHDATDYMDLVEEVSC